MLSYTLAQRMREIGLRLALGAAPRRLQRMVMTDVARLVAIGAALGLVVALLLGRQVSSLLFGLQGHDTAVLASAAAILVAVALLSGWLPAKRVSRIDPIEALRHD
jgi:ABC-type antimicrobial peptide transport system permease subunit